MKTLLLLALAGLLAQATPPRDTSALRPTGSGIIRGRITSSATGQPLQRVRVTLNTQTPNPPTAVTDTRGEYEITGLAAGKYSLTAARSGYLTVQYGQRRAHEPGRSIEVAAGQSVDRVDIALDRAGVLGGVISDDVGDVYPNVRVEAMEFRYLRGRRLLVQAAVATTNDLGQFRIGGLPPGTYFLKASSTDSWQSDDGLDTLAYAMTYYPGVTSSDQAERITLGAGQTLHNLNFGMRQSRAATITGVMRNAAGEPVASQQINLSYHLRGVGGASFALGYGGRGRTDANGVFTIPGLAPGEYTVNGEGGPVMTVILSDGDVKQIVFTPSKPTAAAGSVVTDDGTPLPFAPTLLRVIPIEVDNLFPSFTSSQPVAVTRDATFRFTNMNGPYLFRISGLPPEWMLAAVTLNGKPSTDTPISINRGGPDITNLQVVLSRKSGRVEGQVVGEAGAAEPDSSVVVFSADPSRWTIASRFVHPARPDRTGRFVVTGLPAGTYYAVARDYIPEGQWEDPELLATLAAGMPRIEVREGEAATVTLKLEASR